MKLKYTIELDFPNKADEPNEKHLVMIKEHHRFNIEHWLTSIRPGFRRQDEAFKVTVIAK